MHFEELKIADGTGEFNVNQFRVHFSVPGLSGAPKAKVPLLVSDFIKDFAKVFNGEGKGLAKNRATVRRTKEKCKGKEALEFVMDFKSEALGLNLPDFHSDWVCVEWQSPTQGFAAQTLKHDFTLKDYVPLAPQLGPLEYIIKHYNNHHFLAGRRSWVLGVLDSSLPGWASNRVVVGKKQGNTVIPYAGSTSPIFFLETAAIERYSILAYRLMKYDPGLFINIRKAIVDIWSILLSNYITAKGFRMNTGLPTVWQKDDGNGLWGVSPMRGIYYRHGEFDSAKAVEARQWVNYLRDLHPCLKAQPLTNTQFVGGGGKFGGAGATGTW